MTRRDWWLGIALVVLALLTHAAVPRYEWTHVQGNNWTRADRWTGRLSLAGVANGKWVEVDVAALTPR